MRRLRTILKRPLHGLAMKTGLQSLAEELVQDILRYLHWPTDFYNLCLVSRTLNRLATQELYSILVVGYHRPERISALLAHLELSPELASLVTTLVFDEDIKCIGPKILDPQNWPPRAHRRELADGWDPKSPDLPSLKSYSYNRHHETISKQLNVVLPGLINIRRVIMRSLHPLYMHLGHLKNPRAIANWSYISIDPPSDRNIWAWFSRPLPQITELFVNGVTVMTPPNTMFFRLTTVCISDLYYGINGHAEQAYGWNVLLAHAHNLQTLGMIRVEYAHDIIIRRFFPNLVALEMYKVFPGEPQDVDSQNFSRFLELHSPTLRTLALSTDLCWSDEDCLWLRDENILPNLQTLRLDNTFALLGTEGEATSEAMIQEKNTNVIISFIAHRPSILDVGIFSLIASQADKFAEYLSRTRSMRNIFIGSVAIQSLNSHTSIAQRYWDYSYEAWTFYQLFEGLMISRSGFRPRLPPQAWKFWKKTSS